MEEILARIERIRKEMITIGMSGGFRSDKTLKLSKQLDGLILQYQKLNIREKQIS